MSVLERLNIGLVGAAGRGGSFRVAMEANGARIHAVCDTNPDRLDQCARQFGVTEIYTDYEQMLDRSELDAVVIGTPQHLHVPQAVPALRRNLHVLSEVPAGISLEQCKELAQACRESRALYMLAENYTYMKRNVLVRELARQGLFGQLYYAEGEYLHDVTGLAEQTPWRRYWQLGIDGVTYPTHSLGPILQWMAGDRVVRVSCEGSDRHRKDPRGEEYHQDTSVMLCKTDRGALIKIRTDLVSERPHAMANYQLQGTEGVYESDRAPGERAKIWLRALSQDVRWHDADSLMNIDALAAEYLPEIWRHPPREALAAGHGGGDYFEVADFVNALRGQIACPIGIHEALDMTLPGLISQQSITQAGAWLDVPDSRSWDSEAPSRPQLRMIWPDRLLNSPPIPQLPPGYQLRCYEPQDEAAYIQLMAKAGFTGWTHDNVVRMLQKVLPDGFFVIVHAPTGALVATAMATHNPADLHPCGGELGWVAGDPDHKGRGLGLAVCAAAMARFLKSGYRNIYLLTDDHRLPAIHTYLKLGFEPLLFCEGIEARWDAVFSQLRR